MLPASRANAVDLYSKNIACCAYVVVMKLSNVVIRVKLAAIAINDTILPFVRILFRETDVANLIQLIEFPMLQ